MALAQTAPSALGANVDDLLAAGRRLSPQLRAVALETAAASARADAAGALPDPVFSVAAKQAERMTEFMVEQTFPLWGKRDLQRTVALQAVDASRGRERATQDELDESIKVAFARYYSASQAIGVTGEISRLLRQMSNAAMARYGQGGGGMADTILVEAELTRTAADAAQLESVRDAAAARINALLARPANAPVAEPRRLRALPAVPPNMAALLDRAQANNPRLFTADAEIHGAQAAEQLAHKAWYPDLTVAAGPAQPYSGSTGFDATISFSLPFQTGPKRAGEREAAASLRAAEENRDAALAQIQGDLGEQLAALTAAERVDELLGGRLAAQYQAAWRATLAAYSQGQADLGTVLTAERRLFDTSLERLKVEVEAQTAAASIERLIGGAL